MEWVTPEGILARCRCMCLETTLVVKKDAGRPCWACGYTLEPVEYFRTGPGGMTPISS